MEILQELNYISVTVRLVLALICGGILGLERGAKKRPAGFRTYMLVCMGSALVMITSQYIMNVYGSSDPARMGSQVISGIGFLGAGTIIVTSRNQVKGLTTAAGLWAVACMGLALGIGFYSGAIISGVLIFIIMTILHKMDNFVQAKSKITSLFIEFESLSSLGEFMEVAKNNNMKVSDIEINKKGSGESGAVVLLNIKTEKIQNHNEVIRILGDVKGIQHIEEY